MSAGAFSVISIIGRSGSGKGTQAQILQEKTGFEVIRTGDLLRKRAQETDAVGHTLKETLKRGLLVPTPIVFSLWMPILMRMKNEGLVKGVIFDGNPRKLYEAQMLDEVFEMFDWKERFRAYHLRISDEEAERRLLARGRHDDNPGDIMERLGYFRTEVVPMLEYYKKSGVLVEVNGEQSVEEVHEEIMRGFRDFLE